MSETLQGAEVATSPFSAQHLSQIMVHTFRFSRGSSTSHQPQLAYIANKYRQQVQSADQRLAQELTLQAALGMISSPLHPTYDPDDGETPLSAVADYNVADAYNYLQAYSDGTKSTRCTPGAILCALINADERWRPSQGRTGYTPSRFASNAVEYVILGKRTKVDEIDEMLQAAGDVLESGESSNPNLARSLQRTLPKVIHDHLEGNIDDTVPVIEALANKEYFQGLNVSVFAR